MSLLSLSPFHFLTLFLSPLPSLSPPPFLVLFFFSLCCVSLCGFLLKVSLMLLPLLDRTLLFCKVGHLHLFQIGCFGILSRNILFAYFCFPLLPLLRQGGGSQRG